MSADLLVTPSLRLTGDLGHFVQLGALRLDRDLIVLHLGLRHAVTELRGRSDAYKRQVAQQVEVFFGDHGSRLLVVWVLRVEVLDRVPNGESELGFRLLRKQQVM